ncbi:SnoaL-like domain-containing protein [Dactylonectria macrodidyma]|uniref:SnoaL-like domain-containing protein n=1 Tax=Dactylonectria macrodidyma TaxID=307937 RepID=A0A9P9FVM7_9HYPO|nr:SnoaL-like domain-containing protein [Dactylonectria macrodidyma]
MVPATSDHELIRNCIARYCIGIDLRDWDIFSNAFLDNAKAYFPEPVGAIEGITALKATVQGMVGTLKTQHALSTQLIELTGEKTAEVTTYCRADLFGVGKDEGKCVSNWGMYQDKLVKVFFDGREDWKITERKVISQAPFSGDLSLISK